ncbi:hypothetical protein K469DRAFT_703002 [Zopfia rhizophila CBS 207.26]|uniref:DNA-directed RNA polymerase III subunit RPC9 n=1 Tax=Zopfia rhizophila CBS 207.26 TaxID=1314779 RepID=A0A6A6DBV5_9PEZI|nr:hypothetical protein K469DRAFT_703002 [Zopfia rhizophila CBS 207.26]
MHIKEPQSALLSNHELLLHLQAEEAEYSGTDGTHRERAKPPGLKEVLRDALSYLTPQSTCPSRPTRPLTLYRGPHSLFRALSPQYSLNKAEYLQLYNLRPSTFVELDLVVEEASSRFSESQLRDILDTIRRVFEEEEGDIPAGAEDEVSEQTAHKLEGAKRKRGRKRKA